jgi:hypothetical protein
LKIITPALRTFFNLHGYWEKGGFPLKNFKFPLMPLKSFI